jgi:3-oxoadipate enol-lactonase
MPILSRGSVDLHFELSGDPSRPCLVLSNSLGTNLHMWDPQAQAFEQHFHLLRYDMRGHGHSSTPKTPWSIADLASDVLAILDSLRISRAHFCGLSIGGAIGQWLGAYASDRLHKLVLCNTASKLGAPEIWNARIAKIEAEGMSSIAEATLARWFTSSFLASGNPVIASMKHMLEENNVAGYSATCAAIRDMDLSQAVKAIKAPTLILAGKFDPVTTVQDAVCLQTFIGGAALATIPAAHISNVEAPEIFTSEVLRFLLMEDKR